MDKVRWIVHLKLRPFHFQMRRTICLTRIIKWITRLRRIIRLLCEYGQWVEIIAVSAFRHVVLEKYKWKKLDFTNFEMEPLQFIINIRVKITMIMMMMITIVIFGINTTSDISKVLYKPLGEWNLRQFWNITGIFAKYHVQIMLLFVYTNILPANGL